MADPSPIERIKELVAECVAAMERGERDPAATVCAGEPDLIGPVRERLQRLVEHGLVGVAEPLPVEDELASFGCYRVLRRLGVGGMGSVWLADQTEPVKRQVALKVIKLGMDSEEVLARFRAEREALALLEHPNIARIYDAGVTPEGRPFFAMEFVDGMPITDYADQRELDTDQRLELMLPVCEAVQHAHVRGIIHRDLKPSNILVAERDGKPAPVVIDFGVAKALDASELQRTLFTENGRLIGTPEYMSPEQAGEVGGDVDTRSDVYALGVVVYELLTGTLPFGSRELRDAGWAEMRRILREVDPPTPSSRVSTLDEAGTAIAARRRTSPVALRRELRGELDWITLKALRKEREHRYGSVTAFAEDLRRHLNGEAVHAAPPSRWYRARKTVRRHRAGFALAATAFAGMALALTGIAFGLAEARTQATLAQQNFEDALDTVDRLLVRASKLHLDDVPRATEIEVEFRRDALGSLERLLARKPDSVDLRARVARARFDLADGLRSLNRGEAATELAERARIELRDLHEEGIRDQATLTAYGKTCRLLLEIYTWTKELEAAEAAGDEARRVFAEARERYPDEVLFERLTASIIDRYAALLAVRKDQKGYEAYIERSLAMREELAARYPDGDEHKQALVPSLQTMAMILCQRGDMPGGSELAERAMDLATGLAERDPSRQKRQGAALITNFAAMLDLDLGRRERAESRWREARGMLAELVDDYPNVGELQHHYAQINYYLAAMLADRWGDQPELLAEVTALSRAAAESNRQALAANPEDSRHRGWHRKILQLLVIALSCHEDPPTEELETLAAELEELPTSADLERHLVRHRRNAAALRAARDR